jgi:acyl-[acyl-carrier-protein]-phospholipid O-acyltransferase/long-chain-fatty-acid--[acyl-carrier-protein] ligase
LNAIEKNVTVFSILWLDTDSWWIAVVVVVAMTGLAIWCRYGLLVRFPLWLLRHTIYRLDVQGRENLPADGPALLVSNHVSWIDAALIQAAQKRRIRFLVWAPFLGIPFLRLVLRGVKAIPIDGTAGPRAIVHALRQAGEALANGEVVCIFAEGGITRTGFLLPFQRGLEHIVKHTPAPIIPVCLDHVWGSIFSYQNKRFFWKWPKRLPFRVYLRFGKPLPATSTAFEVRQAIQKLSADSAVYRARKRQDRSSSMGRHWSGPS